jgi:hypothetical protein
MKMVFGDFLFGLRNIEDLMTPIFSVGLVGIRFPGEDCAAMITRIRKHGDHFVDFFDWYQVPVGPLVTGLSAGFALLGFHWTPSLRLGSRSIG